MFRYSFLLIFCVLFILSSAKAIEPDLSKPLNQETFKQWDEYIKQNAPNRSSLNVVINMASRHLLAGRAAVALEIYNMYRNLYPSESQYFKTQTENLEKLMLSQTPQSDMLYIYVNYIKRNSNTENGFLALQRLSDKYINERNWDSARILYKSFSPYFPSDSIRIAKIINILSSPEYGLKINPLSNSVNSQFDEWDPTLTPDGSTLYFSARHKYPNFGNSDVYYSTIDSSGNWQQAQNIGRTINGKMDETVDNISVDGNTLLLSGDFPGTFGNFDIYYAEREENGWGSIRHFPRPINSEFTDEGANLYSDGKAMIFSSDRPGAIGTFAQYGELFHGNQMGNMDIYVSIKTDTGWSAPINLGKTINTPFAERAPYLHPDGKTLYFSSDGHPGLGRLDLFKSTRLNDTSWTEWSEPINLGKEINSANDDWGYSVSLKGDSAFFAAHSRLDGKGGWDLYSIYLPNQAKPNQVVTIRGKVTDRLGKPISVKIKWEDLSNHSIIGEIHNNPQSGSYFIVLPLGKNYGYFAERQGYYPASDNIDLTNIKSNKEIIKNIVLNSEYEIVEQKTKFIIKNIFFDYNMSDLKPESTSELDRLITFIAKHPDKKIHIDGHTDNIGSEQFNLALSQRRTEAVKEYLIAHGQPPNKIITSGFGSKYPIADNSTEIGRAENRRVEISLE